MEILKKDGEESRGQRSIQKETMTEINTKKNQKLNSGKNLNKRQKKTRIINKKNNLIRSHKNHNQNKHKNNPSTWTSKFQKRPSQPHILK